MGAEAARRRAKASGARARDAALGFYLVAYNLAQAAGWGLAFVLLVQGWRAGGPRGAWAAAGPLCYVMQCVAGLEVLHAALGLVKARWSSAALQWVARTNVVALVVAETREIWGEPAVAAMLGAWALGERGPRWDAPRLPRPLPAPAVRLRQVTANPQYALDRLIQ